MRDVGTGYVTCGAREDRSLPAAGGDESVPMRRNGWLFMSGAHLNALVPARCGNRRLSRPIRRNDRLILLWWAVVGRAAVNVNALSLFHMKQLRSPASYRCDRGALFHRPFPRRLQNVIFRFRPTLSALLYFGFRLYCNTAHRPFNYRRGTIVVWSIGIGGWQIGCQVSRKRPFSRYLTEPRKHTPSQFWV